MSLKKRPPSRRGLLVWAEALKEGFFRVVNFQSGAATPPTETDPRAVMRGGGSGIILDEGRFILAPSSWEVTFIMHLGKGDGILEMLFPLPVG